MGLLDEVGGLLGGARQGGGGGSDLASVLPQLLAQNGGLQGLLQKFQQGGAG